LPLTAPGSGNDSGMSIEGVIALLFVPTSTVQVP
jgi:hypothetical protein